MEISVHLLCLVSSMHACILGIARMRNTCIINQSITHQSVNQSINHVACCHRLMHSMQWARRWGSTPRQQAQTPSGHLHPGAPNDLHHVYRAHEQHPEISIINALHLAPGSVTDGIRCIAALDGHACLGYTMLVLGSSQQQWLFRPHIGAVEEAAL